MKRRTAVLTLLFLTSTGLLFAQTGPHFFATIDQSLAFEKRKQEDVFVFDYPLYVRTGLLFGEDYVHSVSFEYIDEPALGETFVQGGFGAAAMKIGYFREDWSAGYAFSVVNELNIRDDRYPDTVFTQTERRPAPLFVFSIAQNGGVHQLALSNREDVRSIDDTTIGLRTVISTGIDLGFGMIRRIGSPPPLFFLTASREEDAYEVWTELGWRFVRNGDDNLNAVVGMLRHLAASDAAIEIIVSESRPLLFLEEKVFMGEGAWLDLGLFFHLFTFSTALDGSIGVSLNPRTEAELGTRLFFGKEGSFFSRSIGDNNNAVYLRLLFQF